MKRAIIAALLLLAGCTTLSSPQAIQDAQKALIAAHTLHDGFALTAASAARSGACVGSCAVTVKRYLDGSEKLLVDADGLSDPANIMADIVAATALISDAKGLLK